MNDSNEIGEILILKGAYVNAKDIIQKIVILVSLNKLL